MLGSQQPKKIEPFQVNFKDGKKPISAQTQADKIIAEFERRLKADPNAKVAITYSANNDQVVDIVKGYTTGEYSIGGSNQAEVIRIVIEEIKKRDWQNKAHILPIATSQHSGGSGVIRMDQVDRDLANIAQHLGAGWQVLGFKNQATAPGAYAVGGGVSKAIWKGKLKARFDAQMQKMTEGDFSDPVLQQAYQAGQQQGVPLMTPAQLKQSIQPTTQPPTKPKSTIGIQVRRKSPEPRETITDPILTQSVVPPTTQPVVKKAPILTAFSQDKDSQFPFNLTTKLTSLFQETNWEINTPNNATITVTDKQDTSKQVKICKGEDAIRLSTAHTDATATEALYQSTAAIEPDQDEILELNVEMTHHYDWKVQLKKMHDSGINIENIKSLKVDGKEIIESAKQSIQEIKQASEKEHLFVLKRRN